MLCCSGLLVLLFTAMFHDLCRWHVAGRPVKRVISAQQHVQLAPFGFQPSPMKASLLAVWLHSFLYIACSSALGTALQLESQHAGYLVRCRAGSAANIPTNARAGGGLPGRVLLLLLLQGAAPGVLPLLWHPATLLCYICCCHGRSCCMLTSLQNLQIHLMAAPGTV